MRNNSTFPALCLLAACALIGCERAETEDGVSWNGSSKPATTTTTTTATTTGSGSSGGSTQPSQPSGGGATAGDAVDFSSLRWSFGGVNGAGAVQSGVVISGLGFSKNGLSFRYNTNLSAWGRSYSHAGDYACLFVQKSDGSWVGGKFDWISSSRTTRDFINVRGGYNGWSFAGVPNPCNAAFVILNHDCKRRSNVLVGSWTR